MCSSEKEYTRLVDWHDVQVGPPSLMVSFAKSMVMFQSVLVTSTVCDVNKQVQLRRHSFNVKRSPGGPLYGLRWPDFNVDWYVMRIQ